MWALRSCEGSSKLPEPNAIIHRALTFPKANLVELNIPLSSSMVVEKGHRSTSTKKTSDSRISQTSSRVGSRSSFSSVDLQQQRTSEAHVAAKSTKTDQTGLAALDTNRKCIKVLILGIDGVGKSTLLRSMIDNCEGPCRDTDRQWYKEIIYTNIIEDIQKILRALRDSDFHFKSRRNRRHILTLKWDPCLKNNAISDSVAHALQSLWDDSELQTCLLKNRSYQLNESCG